MYEVLMDLIKPQIDDVVNKAVNKAVEDAVSKAVEDAVNRITTEERICAVVNMLKLHISEEDVRALYPEQFAEGKERFIMQKMK